MSTTPTVPATPLPAPAWQQVRAQTAMELRLLLRNAESLLITFGIPLGVLVFASVVVPVSLGDGDPVDTLVPATLALAVMSTAFTAQAIQTGFERKYAVLKRLGATPLSRGGFVASKALAVLALVVVQALLVVGVGWLLGWRWPDGASLGWLVGGLVLGAGAFTALGLLLSGTLKAELNLALANAIYLVLAAVGGMALRAGEDGVGSLLALLTPSGALALLLQRALPAGAEAGAALPAAVVLAGWLVAAGLAATRWFRWEA